MEFHSPWYTLQPHPELSLTDLLAPSADKFSDRPAFITVEGQVHTFAPT